MGVGITSIISIAKTGRKNAFSGRDWQSAPFGSKRLASQALDLASMAIKAAIQTPHRSSHHSFQQKPSYRGLKRPCEFDFDDNLKGFQNLAVHGDVANQTSIAPIFGRTNGWPCPATFLSYRANDSSTASNLIHDQYLRLYGAPRRQK